MIPNFPDNYRDITDIYPTIPGTVFCAFSQDKNKFVCLKKTGTTDDQQDLLQAITGISSPFIIHVYGTIQVEGSSFVEMEYAKNISVEELVKVCYI